jgi:hypothetical protein
LHASGSLDQADDFIGILGALSRSKTSASVVYYAKDAGSRSRALRHFWGAFSPTCLLKAELSSAIQGRI